MKNLIFICKHLLWAGFVLTALLHVIPLIAWSHDLELLSHFRVHFALLALLFIPLFGAFKIKPGLIGALVLSFLNLVDLGSWFINQPNIQPESPSLKIMMSNMLYSNQNTQSLHAWIKQKQPDIVIIEELNDSHIKLMQNLKQDYPHAVYDTFYPAFGIGLWSKKPLTHLQEVFLGPAGIEKLDPKGIPSIYAHLKWAGQDLHLLAGHPYPPINADSFDLRNQQHQRMAEFLKAKSGAKILIGDLNITPWSPYYRQLENISGLSNARKGFGILPSWPNFAPGFARIPIDHALVSPELVVRQFQIGPDVGSDHLPIFLELSVKP